MPLPDFIRALAEKKIGEFCEKRIPLYLRNQVTLSFKIRGYNIIIYENRAPWRKELTEWTSMSIAKIKYDEKKGLWRLYCADRNSKWWEYDDLPSARAIDDILAEINRDPTGIFWG